MECRSNLGAFRCVTAPSSSSRDDPYDTRKRWTDICERNPAWRLRNSAAQKIQRWWRRWRLIAEKHASEKLQQLRQRLEHRAARTIQVWNGFHLYRRRASVLALFKYCRFHGYLRHQTLCWCTHCLVKRLCKLQLDVAARRVQTWWRKTQKYRPRGWEMEQALSVLKHGETPGSIATAAHSLTALVRDSRNRSVKRLHTSIVAATCELIGSLPPVELLNQLLKLLAVVGSNCTRPEDTAARFDINLDMIDALLDVIQVYRAHHDTVELAAYILIRFQYFEELQTVVKDNLSIQDRFSAAKGRLDRVATMLSSKRAIECILK